MFLVHSGSRLPIWTENVVNLLMLCMRSPPCALHSVHIYTIFPYIRSIQKCTQFTPQHAAQASCPNTYGPSQNPHEWKGRGAQRSLIRNWPLRIIYANTQQHYIHDPWREHDHAFVCVCVSVNVHALCAHNPHLLMTSGFMSLMRSRP